MDKADKVRLHIRGKVMAVRPRVRDNFFLVQALQVIQCLLGREATDPAGVTLQAGQVVEERRIFGLCLASNFQNVCRALMRQPL